MLGVTGTMEWIMTFPSYWEWNVIIPTDETPSFFRGVGIPQPPTSLLLPKKCLSSFNQLQSGRLRTWDPASPGRSGTRAAPSKCWSRNVICGASWEHLASWVRNSQCLRNLATERMVETSWNPINNGIINHRFQLVQDFATIYSMDWNCHFEAGFYDFCLHMHHLCR